MTSALQNVEPSLGDLIRLSQQFPAAERLLLAKTLLDSLVGDAREFSATISSKDMLSVDEDAIVSHEREAFLALHPTLLNQYPNEYVAIHHGELIDHDKDGLALTLRVYQRFPDEFVWIAPLKTEALEEWVIRSPRFEAVR
ncbi:MAG: hypothetical protein R3C14_24995 [Caldilineaceae bacterium]